jgi:ribose 5-phosphate isomerase A
MPSQDDLKRAAAVEALTRVRSGMRLGLGTGSTVSHFLDLLGQRLDRGDLRDLVGVPTSHRTADHARTLGIPLAELDGSHVLDLTVDGADEVDPGLDLIKGLGGALLREKMVAQASREFLVIIDAAKEVERLGMRAPLPLEVVPFAWKVHLPLLAELGAEVEFRRDDQGRPVYTDNGNVVLDCHFEGGISDPLEVEARLRRRAGVVETGLFLGLATEVIIAQEGSVRTRGRQR